MLGISYGSDLVTCPLFTAISQTCNALHCPDFIKCYALYNYGRLSSVALPLVGGGISSHVGKTCFLISFLFSVVLSFIYSRFGLGYLSGTLIWLFCENQIYSTMVLVGFEYLALSHMAWRLLVAFVTLFLVVYVRIVVTTIISSMGFATCFLFACRLAWLNYIIAYAILQAILCK